jgi:hypothetical protein
MRENLARSPVPRHSPVPHVDSVTFSNAGNSLAKVAILLRWARS